MRKLYRNNIERIVTMPLEEQQEALNKILKVKQKKEDQIYANNPILKEILSELIVMRTNEEDGRINEFTGHSETARQMMAAN